MKNMTQIKKITLNEGFIDLHNRLTKQLCETIWTIERIKPMSQKEIEEFQGRGIIKKKLMESLEKEKKEREENLKVLEELIKKYATNKPN